MTIPADAPESAKLANHCANGSLGEITVSTSGAAKIFDFGEWKSELASRKNPVPRRTLFFILSCGRLLTWLFVDRQTIMLTKDGGYPTRSCLVLLGSYLVMLWSWGIQST
jgi:hypothetical protein